jgi:hypothetical protein
MTHRGPKLSPVSLHDARKFMMGESIKAGFLDLQPLQTQFPGRKTAEYQAKTRDSPEISPVQEYGRFR